VGIPQAVLMSEDQLVKVNNGIDGAAPTPGLDQIDGTVRPHGSVNPLTGLTVTEDFVNLEHFVDVALLLTAPV
jgi:hypothetical protein